MTGTLQMITSIHTLSLGSINNRKRDYQTHYVKKKNSFRHKKSAGKQGHIHDHDHPLPVLTDLQFYPSCYQLFVFLPQLTGPVPTMTRIHSGDGEVGGEIV